MNRNRNDPRSYAVQRARAVRLLETAFKGIGEIDPAFLRACEANYRLAEYERTGSMPPPFDLNRRLDSVAQELLGILAVIERAEPFPVEVPSEAESRRMLARDVFETLKPHGASLSNGWEIANRAPGHADLSGFERLVEALEIHQGDTPAATARWVRAALGENG